MTPHPLLTDTAPPREHDQNRLWRSLIRDMEHSWLALYADWQIGLRRFEMQNMPHTEADYFTDYA